MSNPVLSTVGEQQRSAARAPAAWALAGILLAFFLVRLPLMYRQPGGIDEEQYAIPGLTILRTGLPQLPQLPSRAPESVFFRADEILYAQPPLYFYVQSLFYLILPPVYGTARLVSAISGAGVIWLTSQLAQRPGCSAASGTLSPAPNSPAALWSAGLLSLSRVFFFPATSARPDMLCAFFGMAAIWGVFRWQQATRLSGLILIGVLIGLGGLTHPFAIAYAIQIAVWLALLGSGRERLIRLAVVAGVALAVFSLWLPLILLHPDVFAVQFRNQFLSPDSQGLLWRLAFPWTSLRYHATYLWGYVTPWQALLLLGPLCVCSLNSWRSSDRNLRTVCGLAWSALYLICVCTGPHHFIWGYFAYPAALCLIPAGWLIACIGAWLKRQGRSGPGVCWAGGLLLVASMIPGSGARILATHLRHWSDPNFNAPRFAQQLLATIPSDARCTVDKEFLLDFFAAGRPVLSARSEPIFFSAELYPFDSLICGRYVHVEHLVEKLCVRLERTDGIAADPLACYAEVYRPTSPPCPEHPSR
jgi:4-amino-4-deoxy-L-arabinose transferase-like glycosyltransferase